MKADRKIFHGVMSGVGFTIISIMVTVIQLRILLDFLTKETVGVWLLFLSIGSYIAFFDLGISPTLSREISFILGSNLDDTSRKTQIADILSSCLRIFLILAIIVFLMALVGGVYFLQFVSPMVGKSSITAAWIVFALGASVNLIGNSAFAALYGLGDVATEKQIRSIIQLLGLGLSYLSLYLGSGLLGLAIAWLLQNLLARGVARIILYRNHSWLKFVRGHAQKAIAEKVAIPSLKWAATGLGAILILQTDNIIIATTIGTAAIPKYEAVAKIAMTLMTFSLLIVTSTSPFLSKAYAAGEREVVNDILLRNVRFSVSVIAFLASFVGVFGNRVVDLWLGPGNFVGFPVLWTLLVMVLLEVHHVALATATMATGRIVFAWVAIGAGVLNIIISLILVQYLGLWGVALGTMIAQMLTNNWYVPYVALRHFQIPFFAYLKSTLLPIFTTIIAYISFNLIIVLIIKDNAAFVMLPIALLLSVIFGISMFYFLIMTKHEQRAVAAKMTLLIQYRV